MPELSLGGCRPDSLAGYLKALGVLRLVAEQKDPEALGWWQGEEFVLASSIPSREELVRFFAEEYRPTPIVAPWNKDSGFYQREGCIADIEGSSDPRLEDFRTVIGLARSALGRFGWDKAPGEGDEKARLLATLRASFPDYCVRWLDVVAALAGDEPRWAPLFVAGGVDGRTSFARVFADCVQAAFGLGQGRRRTSRSGTKGPEPGTIEAALFDEARTGVLIAATGGLLVPPSVEGPNASQGFKGGKQLNPWDYLLAMEGTLLLAGSVARCLGAVTSDRASFPFVVGAVGAVAAGHPSAGEEVSRGELWLPLWDRPMGLRELAHLFREGRAEWGGRPATTAVDMARAIVSLGVDRGLAEFRRFGIQGRSGRSHLAVALGRWPVTFRPEVGLLAELDEFLGELGALARRAEAPTQVTRAHRRLEGAILDYAGFGGRDRLLEVLRAAARAEFTIARRPGLRSPRQRGPRVRPLGGLSPGWVAACDDGSVEFELAAAIASLRPAQGQQGPGRAAEGAPGEFRRHLEAIVRRGERWAWAEDVRHEVVWSGRDVLRDLASVLERRLVDAEREGVDPPLDGRRWASLTAVSALLEGEVDLDRLARLVEGLSLVDWRRGEGTQLPRTGSDGRGPESAVPSVYAVLKLAFLGRPIRRGDLEIRVRPDLAILGLLRAGDVWGAVVRAGRRLRAAGLTVRGLPPGARASPLRRDPERGARLLAALLVPVGDRALVRAVVEEEQEAEVRAS